MRTIHVIGIGAGDPDYVTAQARENHAQADLNVASAALRRATGTTLEDRGVRITPRT